MSLEDFTQVMKSMDNSKKPEKPEEETFPKTTSIVSAG